MKKPLLSLLLLALGPFTIFSQEAVIPNGTFRPLDTLQCPFQPDSMVVWPVGWRLYQTQNNRWDGPIDSSHCISVALNELNSAVVGLQQVDPEKALFVRQSLPGEAGLLLSPDYIYELSASSIVDTSLTLSRANNCENELCSGIIAVVEIPDEAGTGTAQRLHRAHFDEPSFYGSSRASACLVTEYFPQNILRELIFKFTFEQLTPQSRLSLGFVGFEYPFFGINEVEELVFPPSAFSGESYRADFYEVARPGGSFYETPYLFMHEREVYPSSENITYIEARPEVPTDEAVSLEATIDRYQSLHFQPYTAIRGALVSPDDTIRHQFTLVGEGAEWCFLNGIELIVSDGAEVEFRSGTIHFAGLNSCMMFRDGGALRIPDNTRFVYGQDAKGALGLNKGGTIRIGRNSELVINNTLILANFLSGADRQVYMELNPGSRLTFGENARLIRQGHLQTGQMRLNVFMKGGILDDGNLSAYDRRLINRIYPDKNAILPADHLWILGNPARDQLVANIFNQQTEIVPARWMLHNLQGQLIRGGRFDARSGLNKLTIGLDGFAEGMYLLSAQLGQQPAAIRKVVVHR